MDDGTPKRSVEAEVMALFEQMIVCIEEAQGYIQDDSRVTNIRDVQEIMARTLRIRALSMEIDKILRPPQKH